MVRGWKGPSVYTQIGIPAGRLGVHDAGGVMGRVGRCVGGVLPIPLGGIGAGTTHRRLRHGPNHPVTVGERCDGRCDIACARQRVHHLGPHRRCSAAQQAADRIDGPSRLRLALGPEAALGPLPPPPGRGIDRIEEPSPGAAALACAASHRSSNLSKGAP